MAMKLYDVIRKDQASKTITEDQSTSVYIPPSVDRSRVRRGGSRHSWRKIAVIAGALTFITVLYLIGILFVHATVTVVERQIPFSLQDTQIDLANATTADPGRLSFQTMVVTDSVSREVFGSAMTTSTSKATGEAVIFNQYSKSKETVVHGTILTGANGEKYSTESTITVPGYTGSGSTKVPGSASVAIVAAGVGPAYNSAGTTFTVTGWAGANAKNFFASSAGAITGGQNGAMNTLSDTDKQQTITNLQAALTEKLSRETRAQIPNDFITFPNLQFTTMNTNSMVLTGSGIQFPASLSGTMVSYLIPRDLLEQAIAAKAVSDHSYTQVTIPALGDITVEPVSIIPADPSQAPDTLTISVSGQGTIITQVSPSVIQQAVVGIPAGSFTGALAGIPEIDTAKFSLNPFWAPYFPYKISRITVNIQ